jgi:hypothetical protein
MPRQSGHFLFISIPFYFLWIRNLVMASFRFYIALVFVFVGLQSNSQSLFSKDFSPELYRSITLHQSVTSFDVLLNRYAGSQISLNTDFYRSGFTAFSPYLDLPICFPALDTMKARTNLNLMLGSERDQLLFVEHHQNLGKGFTAGLHYNSIVSPGFLRSQLAKNKAFGVFAAVDKLHYSGILSFHETKVSAAENGGIIDTVIESTPSRSALDVIPVQLSGANSLQRKQIVELSQHYFVKDSLSGLQFHLLSNIIREGRSYREATSLSELYPVALDTVSTYDTSFFNVATIAPSVSYNWLVDSIYKLELNAGMRHRYSEYRIDDSAKEMDWQEYTFKSMLSFRKHIVEVNGSLANGESYNGNYTAALSYMYQRNTKWIDNIRFSVLSQSCAAAITDQYYSSNHFQWSNNFVSEDLMRLKVESEILLDHILISASSLNFRNKVVYNDEGYPQQLSENRTVNELTVTAKTVLGKVSFLTYAMYRPTVFKEYPQPETEIYARIAFRNRYFKSALNAEGGFSGFITSSFAAPWYDPATGRYRTQQEVEVGGSPVINAFVNLRIKTATISVLMENLGYGWIGKPLYSGPQNPAAPRILRISVSWLLSN